MKSVIVCIFFLFPCIISAQNYNGNKYGDIDALYDYNQDKYIDCYSYKEIYGRNFYRDVMKLSSKMKYASKETDSLFCMAVAHRQMSIENNYEIFRYLRTKNKKKLSWGIPILSISWLVEIVAPIYIYKAAKDVAKSEMYDRNVVRGGTYYNQVPKVKNKSKAMIITSSVCSAGIITGIGLITSFIRNRNQYDPGFILGNELYIQEFGTGLSIVKNF